MKVKLLLLSTLIVFGLQLQAQYYKITGRLLDKQTNLPITGATVVLTDLNDTIVRYYAISDADGNFSISHVSTQSYRLKPSFIGYKKIEKIVTVQNFVENVGHIYLSPENKLIGAVVITGQSPAAEQKGDTTEMNANAYKTTKDASAEDLVQKMPTVSIDQSGTVKAQGETVQKVLVDGKPFFGDDPTVALRSLPAEIIDKVQIYNELSDQSKLTGFDDGNTTKTMNIVTKANNREGVFGKMYGGYGTDEKYQVGENLNFFQGDRRFSIIGMSNNINQQNFSSQDLLGLSGGSSGRGHGGGKFGGNNASNFLIGNQSGVSTTNSIGVNYSDDWGPKIKVSTSYFFNYSNNNLEQDIYQNYFTKQKEFINTNDTAITRNYNHRFNMRFEYDIDSLNTLILVPNMSFQTNISTDTTIKYDYQAGQTNNLNNTNAFGYNLSNNLTFRHKFDKKGRTVSLSLTTTDNYGYPKILTETDSLNRKTDSLNRFTNQNQSNLSKGYVISSNIMYTEPLGNISLLQVNYKNTINHNNDQLYTYNLLKNNNPIDTSLSNTYNSNYITNSAGLGFRIHNESFNGAFTMNYQVAQLTNASQFPINRDTTLTFKNWMPLAFIRFKLSDKNNIMVIYRTTTAPPSISQLQNVVNNTNLPDLSVGNPNLKQQYTHNFISRIAFANPEKSTNFFAFISANYTLDPVGTSQSKALSDSIINGIELKKGARLDMPINLDHSWQFNTFMNYGFPLHFMKSNLNFNAGLSYSQVPGKINNEINYTNSFSVSPGAVLSSNVSENLDFTVMYFGGYNFVKSTLNSANINNYYSHSAGIKFSWIFWKGIVWTNDFTNQYYKGLSSTSYNQDYILWNMGLGKKLFHNQRGEIKLSVYDLLNQNRIISQTINGNYLQDTQTNALKRYLMLTFTYNLRQFKQSGNGGDYKNFDHPQFDHPHHDHSYGGPPPGGF